MLLSLIIPAKDKNDPKLADLLCSIEAQDFPKDQMEVLVITEGTSESAKAIGIKKAKGDVIGILASDNILVKKNVITNIMQSIGLGVDAVYSKFYAYSPQHNLINRYYALFGFNDPLAFYMGKNDKKPWYELDLNEVFSFMRFNNFPTLGDNGFFIKRSLILKTDLENYYHIDNIQDCGQIGICRLSYSPIAHQTSDSIIKSMIKRFKYGIQHAFNPNRRWHLVDFRQPKDIVRLLWFIFASLTVIHPLFSSIRGYLKVRDVAWFLHPVVCLMTLFTYALLVGNLGIKRLSQLLFVPLNVQKA